ncbi:MAG TPA: methylaspartate ammonia-lyase [Gaiellaceae bacterium]|jgi:methylaspartate ammonia-lyase|nr:methylaspartate ammonia-lyase [Gaiellaceae bacterium]
MRIDTALFEQIRGGYFYDDQAAVRAGARADGEWISGDPVTGGFSAVRMPATGIAVGLRLDDGTLVWGDAISVQYPGVADRDPPLVAETYLPLLAERLGPALSRLETSGFRTADREAVAVLEQAGLSHKAIEYGVSQALLAAAAHAGGCTMAEIVCREFELPVRAEPVPIFAQTGDRRHDNADKMIMKRVDVLPHGLINNAEKFGPDGEAFLEYVAWIAGRIAQLSAGADYAPALHFDLYGIAGKVFDGDAETIAAYLARVAEAAKPYPVSIETPVIAASRAEQIERLAELRGLLRRDGTPLGIAADEWCNTLEDIRAFISADACDMVQIKMPDLGSVSNSILAAGECRRAGMKAYLGGSCAETELSARVAVHIAVATQVDMQLAKPGMGVDEGLMIVANEQTRLLAELRTRG